jgi:hypothetical protein
MIEIKSITKNADALSSTKEILKCESKAMYSVTGRAELKLKAKISRTVCIATETYFK